MAARGRPVARLRREGDDAAMSAEPSGTSWSPISARGSRTPPSPRGTSPSATTSNSTRRCARSRPTRPRSRSRVRTRAASSSSAAPRGTRSTSGRCWCGSRPRAPRARTAGAGGLRRRRRLDGPQQAAGPRQTARAQAGRRPRRRHRPRSTPSGPTASSPAPTCSPRRDAEHSAPRCAEVDAVHGVRLEMARRMSVSRREIPDAHASVQVDGTRLLALRDRFAPRRGVRSRRSC